MRAMPDFEDAVADVMAERNEACYILYPISGAELLPSAPDHVYFLFSFTVSFSV